MFQSEPTGTGSAIHGNRFQALLGFASCGLLSLVFVFGAPTPKTLRFVLTSSKKRIGFLFFPPRLTKKTGHQ